MRKRLHMGESTPGAAAAATVHQSYGVHMAISMAIGFLFLGGACCKFSTSPTSVALLLLSMWPALPAGPTDNRCHLQVRSSTLARRPQESTLHRCAVYPGAVVALVYVVGQDG